MTDMIIDFHTHIFPDKVAGGAVASLASRAGTTPYSDGTSSGLIASMEASGVDIAINLPVLTRAAQFDSILRFGREINQKVYTGATIISFAGIHADEEDVDKRLDEVVECGFLGIKIHPDYQGTFFDDERYIRILDGAKRRGLITVTHAGIDGAFLDCPIRCTPTRVLRVLDRLGGYDRLVLAHLGGTGLIKEVISSLAGENVYLDTAHILTRTDKSDLERLLAKHGEDKILFATDSPWGDMGEFVAAVRTLSLGSAVEEKIFSANARRLLKI